LQRVKLRPKRGGNFFVTLQTMASPAPNPAKQSGNLSLSDQRALQFWEVPWKFAIHGVVGTSIFAIIAAFAVALDFGVHRLEALGVSKVILLALEPPEYALLLTDVSLFAVFLYRTAKRSLKEL
jgi:hypothetical protein